MNARLLAFAFIAAASVTASGVRPDDTRPDFSGNWVIDMEKSSIPKGSRIAANIIHTEGTLIVGVSGPHHEVVYGIGPTPAVQGRPRRNHARSPDGDGLVERLYRSWWEGAKVVTEITTPDGSLVSTETRYMDGHQMVVTETSPDGRRVVSYWTKRAEIADVKKQ